MTKPRSHKKKNPNAPPSASVVTRVVSPGAASGVSAPSDPSGLESAPSFASTVDPHNAAEAAAVAIPDDATPHDLMPWTPPQRAHYSDAVIAEPCAWRVVPLLDFMLGGEPCERGVPLSSDRVTLLDARVLRRIYESRHVLLEHVEPTVHIAAGVDVTASQGVIDAVGG